MIDPDVQHTGPEPQQILNLPGLLHGRDNVHGHVESLLDAIALLIALAVCAVFLDPRVGTQYLVLSLVVITMTYPGRSRLHASWPRLIVSGALDAAILISLLVFFGWATGYLSVFASSSIRGWLWVGPLLLVAIHAAFRLAAPLILRRPRPCVIVGANEQGMTLASRIEHNRYSGLKFVGFFDDRAHSRANDWNPPKILGQFADLEKFVEANQIQVIYLSLPMASQQRTLKLLDGLRDTTASIYFVPDQFVTELIQGRTSSVVDIPVVAVCETPFVGVNAILKRVSDVLISVAALIVLSPILLLLAFLVRFDSPGPALFRQRRYGLDGQEINVYKFRSMRVEENGTHIQQATRNDPRITRLGAFMRRTSLDELPQLVNVLQGRMSIVGPRPHAVAHNELYRKLIKGYMVRHKVRPGITGWAQVNGLRGETDTVEKMAARIRYDLDYLRHWSLRLDMNILVRTVTSVLNDKQAY